MKKKYEIILITFLIVVSAVAHGYNMLKYPYYENDEGTYMSQAWSLVERGELAPYTYWYDHAPAGWIFIASWVKITGGFFTFGDAVVSGRIFMLLLHVASSLLLYYITKKVSNSILAASIAVLLFSLSPLGIYFQRRILLDNIMIFWSFSSIALLLKDKLKLRHIIASGLFFGIAVLTKENAIFFIPAVLYAIYLHSHEFLKRFALAKWLATAGSVISTYFLYAILKGEFLPVKDGESRVSLLDTLAFQSNRGSGLPFWDSGSDFYTILISWLDKDPYIIMFGIASGFLMMFIAFKNKQLRLPVLLTILYWIFLTRGGIVLDFYVVPLIPLLTLGIGVTLHRIIKILPIQARLTRIAAILIGAGILVLPSATFSYKHFTQDETSPQLESVTWIRNNISTDATIIIEAPIFVEVRNPNKGGIYNNADWYWKAQLDPEIRQDKYDNDWRNVDYLMLSHETLKTIKRGEGDFINEVLKNSKLVKSWGPVSPDTYLNVENRISTNGDWVQIYKIKDEKKVALEDSWRTFKQQFIISYGQVVEPYANNRTTSEGQSYALLRAVWMNDRDVFDGVWKWTQDHMQYRTDDKLFSWLWYKNDAGEYELGDPETASDADQDIALALLFAYKNWNDESYLNSAKEIISDIWEKEVVQIGNKYYLASSTNSRRGNKYLINPSYLSPSTYRIFAKVDPKNNWLSLVDSTYSLLYSLSDGAKNSTKLPPNWIAIDGKTGDITSAREYIDESADIYSYDAFRIMWRIALDAMWYEDPRAIEYLNRMLPFFERELKLERLVSGYSIDGKPVTNSKNISTDIGALAVFAVNNNDLAVYMYKSRLKPTYNKDGYWEEQNNYYGQNWAWFGIALFNGSLTNLWETN